MRALLLGASALALASCGNRPPLEPQAGQSLPPPLPGAIDPPTTDELTDPGPQARPDRTDEILKRSEERQPDRFDLPPD